MDTTIGTSQASIVFVQNNIASAQNYYFTRFVSDPLSGISSITAQTWTYNFAAAESSASANFPLSSIGSVRITAYVWRPGTQTKVGDILDGISAAAQVQEGTAGAQRSHNATFTGSAVASVADGDVICFEVWFQITQTGTAGPYTDTFYYDGTTVTTSENTTVSNHASFLETPQTLAFSAALTRVSSSIIYKYKLAARVTDPGVYKYKIVGRILSSRIYKYALSARILSSRIYKYKLAARVISFRIYKYQLFSRILSTRIYKYALFARILSSRIYKYNLIARVLSSRTYKYALFSRIVSSRVYKYALLSRIISSRTYKYAIAQRVLFGRIYKYNILSKISLSRIYRYGLRTQVSLSRIYRYSVQARVSLSSIYRYTIRTKISISRTYLYKITGRISLSRIYKYNLTTRVALSRAYLYRILVKTSLARIYRYSIRTLLSTARTYRYNVLIRVTSSRIYRYALIQRIVSTRIYKYAIIQTGRVATSRTYKYQIIQRITSSTIFKYNILQRVGSIPIYNVAFSGANSGAINTGGRTRYGTVFESASALLTKQLKTWTVQLKKTAGATGTVDAAIYDSTSALIASSIESFDASTLDVAYSISYKWTFSSARTIAAGDHLVIRYAGTTAIQIRIHNTDQFDAGNTRRTSWDGTSWISSSTDDVDGIITDGASGYVQVYKYKLLTKVTSSRTYKYNILAKISLARVYKYNTLEIVPPRLNYYHPLYIYPNWWIGTPYNWTPVINTANANPDTIMYIVLNVNSGPDTLENTDYSQHGIPDLKNVTNHNIKVLGYVSTHYADIDITTVKDQISKWYSFYGINNIDGIMLDEMEDDTGDEAYYSELTAYTKSISSRAMVVANPGKNVAESYINTVDKLIVWENNGSLPTEAIIQTNTFYPTYARNKFIINAYNISQSTALDKTYLNMIKKYIFGLGVTDDIAPNPYDTIPTYFNQIVNLFATLGGKIYKYNILARITSLKVYKYALLAIVTSFRTYRYKLIARLSLSQIYKYAIIQVGRVATSRTYKYQIIQRITSQTVYKYRFLTRLSLSRVYKYNLLKLVSLSRIYKYAIIAELRVSLTNVYRYNIIGRLSLPIRYKYNILNAVSISRTYLYRIFKLVSISRIYKYAIIQDVFRTISSLTYRYNIFGRLKTAHIYKYAIEYTVKHRNVGFDVKTKIPMRVIGGFMRKLYDRNYGDPR